MNLNLTNIFTSIVFLSFLQNTQAIESPHMSAISKKSIIIFNVYQNIYFCVFYSQMLCYQTLRLINIIKKPICCFRVNDKSKFG